MRHLRASPLNTDHKHPTVTNPSVETPHPFQGNTFFGTDASQSELISGILRLLARRSRMHTLARVARPFLPMPNLDCVTHHDGHPPPPAVVLAKKPDMSAISASINTFAIDHSYHSSPSMRARSPPLRMAIAVGEIVRYCQRHGDDPLHKNYSCERSHTYITLSVPNEHPLDNINTRPRIFSNDTMTQSIV